MYLYCQPQILKAYPFNRSHKVNFQNSQIWYCTSKIPDKCGNQCCKLHPQRQQQFKPRAFHVHSRALVHLRCTQIAQIFSRLSLRWLLTFQFKQFIKAWIQQTMDPKTARRCCSMHFFSFQVHLALQMRQPTQWRLQKSKHQWGEKSKDYVN